MAIFPQRVDVSASTLQTPGRGLGVVLRMLDDARRQPFLTIALTPEQSRTLLDDLLRGLYPEQADDALAHLP